MAEFDRSEHRRPDAVIDAPYEDFDPTIGRNRRRAAMAIGGPLVAILLVITTVVVVQARNAPAEEAAADLALQTEVRLQAQEVPLLFPESRSNEEGRAIAEQLRAQREITDALAQVQAEEALVITGADLAPAGDPWFLGLGLLWLLLPIALITLIPVLRQRLWSQI